MNFEVWKYDSEKKWLQRDFCYTKLKINCIFNVSKAIIIKI